MMPPIMPPFIPPLMFPPPPIPPHKGRGGNGEGFWKEVIKGAAIMAVVIFLVVGIIGWACECWMSKNFPEDYHCGTLLGTYINMMRFAWDLLRRIW